MNKEIDLNQSFSEKRKVDPEIIEIQQNTLDDSLETNNTNDNKTNDNLETENPNDSQKKNYNEKSILENSLQSDNPKNNITCLQKSNLDKDTQKENMDKINDYYDFIKMEELYNKIVPFLDIYVNANYKESFEDIYNNNLNDLLSYISTTAEKNMMDNKENISKYKENCLLLYFIKKINSGIKTPEEDPISKGNKYYLKIILLIFVLIIIPRFLIFLYHK